MNRTAKTAYSVSIILAIVLALSCVAIRTFLFFAEYDEALGHFAPLSLMNDAFNVLILVSIIAFIIPSVIMRKAKDIRVSYTDIPTLFSTAFLSIALLLFAIFVLIDASTLQKSGASLFFSVLCFIFALGSIPYYILRICTVKVKSEIYALLSIFPILLGCSFAFYFYFDNTMYMNSPVLILHQVAAMFIAFFALGEARIELGRVKWGLYIAVGLTAFTVTLADSLPYLFYIPAAQNVTYAKTAIAFLVFAFSLYIISRIFAIYALNSRDAEGLITFFKSIYGKKEDADGTEPHAEQLIINLSGEENNAQNEQK